MSLTLFSFDVQSLFKDWQDLFGLPENELPEPEIFGDSSSVNENALETENDPCEVETATEEIAPQIFSAPAFTPVQITKPVVSNQKDFEEFVKTLRGALMHTYQGSDLSNGGMSQNFNADPRGNFLIDENRKNIETDKKKTVGKEELRAQFLREELRKAILKPAKDKAV